jgi:hypothetical protein
MSIENTSGDGIGDLVRWVKESRSHFIIWFLKLILYLIFTLPLGCLPTLAYFLVEPAKE